MQREVLKKQMETKEIRETSKVYRERNYVMLLIHAIISIRRRLEYESTRRDIDALQMVIHIEGKH